MTEPIIINGLSCDTCPEKERCKDQQNKKDMVLLEIINYIKELIRSEYHKHLDILWGNIPKITRCDVVLEKLLQRKTGEYLHEINKNNRLKEELNQIKLLLDGKNIQYASLNSQYKELQKTFNNNIFDLMHANNKLQIATEALEKYIKVNCENCEELVEPSCSSCDVADLQQALERIKE